MRKSFAVISLLLVAGCGSPLPGPTVTPVPSSVELVTRADVEYADAEVHAAAKYLDEVCSPNGGIKSGDVKVCPPKPLPNTPSGDLEDARKACHKAFDLYNAQAKDGLVKGGQLVPGTTDNTQVGDGRKITCEA